MQFFKLSSFRWLTLATIFLCTMSFNGLQAQISSATITVNTLSVAPTGATATPLAICTGASTTLDVQFGLLGTGAVWNWYADGCGTGASIGTGTSLTVSPVNLTLMPITVTYFVRAEGICNTTTCAQVSVIVDPAPTFTVPVNATYCVGANVAAQILTGLPLGLTFDIEGGAAIGLADVTGVIQVPAFVATNTTNASITSTITITPQTLNCTGLAQTFTITVTPEVTMTPVVNQILCNTIFTNAITLTSNVGSGVTYNWTNTTPSIGLAASGSGDIAAFNAVNTSCVDVVATITVTPTMTDGTTVCVEAPIVFTITVRPTPNGTLASTDICEGELAMLTFNASCGTGPFELEIRQDLVVPNQEYTAIISGTAFNVTPNPITPGVHTYDLMVIVDANGCILE